MHLFQILYSLFLHKSTKFMLKIHYFFLELIFQHDSSFFKTESGKGVPFYLTFLPIGL